MRDLLATLATLAVALGTASAQDSTIWSEQATGEHTVGWVVQLPSGSSDFASVTFTVDHGPVSQNVAGSVVSVRLPIKAVGVNVADFGTTTTFPTVGVFRPNTTLDPSGNTPDLALPVAVSTAAITPGTPLFTYQAFPIAVEPSPFPAGENRPSEPEAMIPPSDATTIVAVQLPPGDSGTLAIGADISSGSGTSGFTDDGYQTAAVLLTSTNLGLSLGQDNSSNDSCKQSARKPHGRLRVQGLAEGKSILDGDQLTTHVAFPDQMNLSFFGAKPGDRWRIFFAFPCTPAIALGPLLPTLADEDGDGSYLRVNVPFPEGYAGNTLRFAALWGNPSCNPPGTGFTNCVTMIVDEGPLPWGVVDNGFVESGWTVQLPSGPSDYFNNSFGPKPAYVNDVVGLTIAVLDFVTAVPAYPSAGVSNANTTVDPSGNTPDVSGAGLLALVAPFTFPSGTFATTSARYITHAVSIAGSAFVGPSGHGWVQFPPGDDELGVGVEEDKLQGRSYQTLGAYSSPALSFFADICLRLKTN